MQAYRPYISFASPKTSQSVLYALVNAPSFIFQPALEERPLTFFDIFTSNIALDSLIDPAVAEPIASPNFLSLISLLRELQEQPITVVISLQFPGRSLFHRYSSFFYPLPGSWQLWSLCYCRWRVAAARINPTLPRSATLLAEL